MSCELQDCNLPGFNTSKDEPDPSVKDTNSGKMGEALGTLASSDAGQTGKDQTDSTSEKVLQEHLSPSADNGLNPVVLQSSPAASSESSKTDPPCDSSNISSSKSESSMVVGRSVKTRVLQRINSGSFGKIHLGILIATGQEVAVKLEKQKSLTPQLLNEGNIMRHLEGGPGIPKVHWFGIYEPEYNVMVMDLLGPSLQDLFSYCKHTFSLKTVLMLADQIMDIFAYIHKNHYIYRDVKPDNFMIGRGENSHRVYIIDFGLAKKVTAHRFSAGHIVCNVVHPLVGTVRYASIHAHLGHDESQRDDLESLAYVFIYFLRGRLPWQSIPVRNKEEKFSMIKECKLNTPIQMLCEGLPSQFAQFLDTARLLRKEAVINYRQFKEMFQNLAKEKSITYDYQFDWIICQAETGHEVGERGRSDHGHDSS